jgi:two-component system, response regulator PdtaR
MATALLAPPGIVFAASAVVLALPIRNRWPPIHLIIASGRTILEESQLPIGLSFFSKPYDNNSIVEEMTRNSPPSTADGSDRG